MWLKAREEAISELACKSAVISVTDCFPLSLSGSVILMLVKATWKSNAVWLRALGPIISVKSSSTVERGELRLSTDVCRYGHTYLPLATNWYSVSAIVYKHTNEVLCVS